MQISSPFHISHMDIKLGSLARFLAISVDYSRGGRGLETGVHSGHGLTYGF